MPLSEFDKNHIREILYDGHGDWFTAQLLRLILKADYQNRAKLAVVFPEEVGEVELYEHGQWTIPME